MSSLTRQSYEERRSAFVAQLETTSEFKILDDLLHGDESSNGLNTAVDLIAHRVNASTGDQDQLVDQVCTVAQAVVELAYREPAPKLGKLLSFLEAIQQRAVEDATGQPVTIDDGRLWTDMPTFGYTFSDELSSIIPTKTDISAERRRQQENLSAFTAALTSRSIAALGFLSYAATAFFYAFGPVEGGEPPATENSVRLACLWIIYAGEFIWEKIQNKPSDDWNSAEWNRSKQLLVEYQQRFNGEETKALISDALAIMEKVEQVGKS